MIFIKFLKQQNWWLAMSCILFLWLFQYIYIGVEWALFFATAFLILYSFKFAGKHSNLFIDRLKLAVYFLYFTARFMFRGDDIEWIVYMLFPYAGFYLYFYTILLFYKREMEEQGKTIRRSIWWVIIVVQTFLFFGIIIWAFTQKVEADKQKELANIAKGEAMKSKKEAEEAKIVAEIVKRNELIAKDETSIYRMLYEQEKLKNQKK